MHVDIFTLCEFASAEGGKMTIVGTFNSVWAREAPIKARSCTLAMQMRFAKVEEGAKRLRITFIDADGGQVLPALELVINVRVPEDRSSAIFPACVTIQQWRLPNFGEYSIDLAVDGRQEASIPLFVRQIPLPPPPSPPPAQTQ